MAAVGWMGMKMAADLEAMPPKVSVTIRQNRESSLHIHGDFRPYQLNHWGCSLTTMHLSQLSRVPAAG